MYVPITLKIAVIIFPAHLPQYLYLFNILIYFNIDQLANKYILGRIRKLKRIKLS